MGNTNPSTTLCESGNKFLSNWDGAIKRAKRQVAEMKRSIRVFEEMRDRGMRFPAAERERRRKGESGNVPSP